MFSFDNPLVQALHHKDLTLFKETISQGYDLHSDSESALRYASCYCDLETNLYILSLGADPLCNNHEPLYNAIHSKNLPLVKHLISIGSDPHLQGDEYPSGSIGIACRNDDLATVQYLSSIGCSINLNNHGAIYHCFIKNYSSCLDYLISLPQFDAAACAKDLLETACEYKTLSLIDWAYKDLQDNFPNLNKVLYNEQFLQELYTVCQSNLYYEGLQHLYNLTDVAPEYLLYLKASRGYNTQFSQQLLKDYGSYWQKNYKQVILASFSTCELNVIEQSLEMYSQIIEKEVFKNHFSQIAFAIERTIIEEYYEDIENRIVAVLEAIDFNYDVDEDEYPSFHKIALYYTMNKNITHHIKNNDKKNKL